MKYTIAFCLFLIFCVAKSQQLTKPSKVKDEIFKISIERKISTENCTQGYLSVDDSVIAYTLELPNLDNRNYISSIPKGEYSAFIRTDGQKGWRIELLEVPDRKNVQIHLGNYTRDIDGCILVGTKVNIDNCEVFNNFKREAIDNIQKLFNSYTKELILGSSNPKPLKIIVEVSGI